MTSGRNAGVTSISPWTWLFVWTKHRVAKSRRRHGAHKHARIKHRIAHLLLPLTYLRARTTAAARQRTPLAAASAARAGVRDVSLHQIGAVLYPLCVLCFLGTLLARSSCACLCARTAFTGYGARAPLARYQSLYTTAAAPLRILRFLAFRCLRTPLPLHAALPRRNCMDSALLLRAAPCQGPSIACSPAKRT